MMYHLIFYEVIPQTKHLLSALVTTTRVILRLFLSWTRSHRVYINKKDDFENKANYSTYKSI
jgi:hypothetical protein